MMASNQMSEARKDVRIQGGHDSLRGMQEGGAISKEMEAKSLAETRLILEQNYMNQWQEGKRMRKKPLQMNVLMEHFNQDPSWSYALKMKIATQIGMTPNQVSKWNWDMRKKMGLPTERKKNQKK
jgi:hypothetical protein